jgi:hypothetical protein
MKKLFLLFIGLIFLVILNAQVSDSIKHEVKGNNFKDDFISQKQKNDEKAFLELIKRYNSAISDSSEMEAIFSSFVSSIQKTNSDMEYFLKRLEEHNRAGEVLGEFIKGLNSKQITKAIAIAQKYPTMQINLIEGQQNLNIICSKKCASKRNSTRILKMLKY